LEKETEELLQEKEKVAKEVHSMRKKLFELKAFLLEHRDCFPADNK